MAIDLSAVFVEFAVIISAFQFGIREAKSCKTGIKVAI